jgi:hypothetical protein
VYGCLDPPIGSGAIPDTEQSSWFSCYQGTYDVELNSTVLAYILNQCYKDKLLLGCGPVDSDVLTLAAWGRRKDVLYDCGKQRDCVRMVDSVGWYYSDDYSWGFVRDGDSVNRMTCDTGEYTFESITMLESLSSPCSRSQFYIRS